MNDTEKILAERQRTHGSFETHSQIAQDLKYRVQDSPSWNKMNKTQKEGLEMILHKIARIVSGNPEYADHWDDIAGYATLVSKDLVRRGMVAKP